MLLKPPRDMLDPLIASTVRGAVNGGLLTSRVTTRPSSTGIAFVGMLLRGTKVSFAHFPGAPQTRAFPILPMN